MSIIITTRLRASSTECIDGEQGCTCHDILEGSKGANYHFCYLYHKILDGNNRCDQCLADERDKFVGPSDRRSLQELLKYLKKDEKKGTKQYLKKLVSILNGEAGLKKYKITPAEHYQLNIISKDLLRDGYAEFISSRLCELLLELDFYVTRKGIGYLTREKDEFNRKCEAAGKKWRAREKYREKQKALKKQGIET